MRQQVAYNLQESITQTEDLDGILMVEKGDLLQAVKDQLIVSPILLGLVQMYSGLQDMDLLREVLGELPSDNPTSPFAIVANARVIKGGTSRVEPQR